jgi:hypothetical protein
MPVPIVPIGISSGLTVAVGGTTYSVASAANWNLTGVNWSSEGKLLVQGAISGQATDGASPGVMGMPLSGPNSPTTGQAIGVKGDGGGGHGETRQAIGVFGTTSDPTGIGVYGENPAGGLAGSFKGNFQVAGNEYVSGDLSCGGNFQCNESLTCNKTITALVDVVLGSDCAEDFDIVQSAQVEPGMVMVFTDNGDLQVCRESYDKRVAGIISGAGDYKPGIILGRGRSHPDRLPVALVGRVYCKADAEYGPIEVGDLLTTSPTPGHAMRALDPLKAFGAVIGKALRPLRVGQGLITVLVGLR